MGCIYPRSGHNIPVQTKSTYVRLNIEREKPLRFSNIMRFGKWNCLDEFTFTESYFKKKQVVKKYQKKCYKGDESFQKKFMTY